MQRWMKLTALLSAVVFTFSLIGCGTANDSGKEQKHAAKTTAVEKNKAAKSEQSTNKSKTLVEENKPVPAAPQINIAAKATKTALANPAGVQEKTDTTKSTKNKSAVAAPAPSQGATTSVSSPPPASSAVPASPKPADTVTFSIIGPKGTIIGAKKVEMKDGDTMFTVLLNAAKQSDIMVDYRGSGATTYISGIDNIYEFDYGAKSGWIFKLNGQEIPRSVGVMQVKSGDQIECIYVQ